MDLKDICINVIKLNKRQWLEFKNGKQGLLGYFIGQAMKLSNGTNTPIDVQEIFLGLQQSDADNHLTKDDMSAK